jgi:hypothetical protein
LIGPVGGSKVRRRRAPKILVLGMDWSESPVYGEQEGSAYNGHFNRTRCHPLFVFNQFGDVERCAPRPATCMVPMAGARCRRR